MAGSSFAHCLLYTTLFFSACTAAGLAMGYALEKFRSQRVWALALRPGQTAHEFWGNVQFFVVVVPACALAWWSGWLRVEGGAARAVFTFLAFHFCFQAYFYALHRALHTRRLVRFHRWHHESRVTTPLSGQSVSVGEAVGWAMGYAGLPVLMSQVTPIEFGAVVAYVGFNVVGNIAGHANTEVVPPSKSLWWRSMIGTVFTYHALHHARWNGNYGFASAWADRLFKTEWPDWPILHKKVWSGVPMKHLKERG